MKDWKFFSIYFTELWRRQWHPTPVLLPGKSHGRRSLVGCSPWGLEESDTTERRHFHFSLSCIGEGNGNPFQCSCLENPRDRGAWWAAIYGVAQSRTRLKRLSSSIVDLQCAKFCCIAKWFSYTYSMYNILCIIFFSTILSQDTEYSSQVQILTLPVAWIWTSLCLCEVGILIGVPTLSLQFSCSVMFNSLWPSGLQHTRLPCPSPTPRACSNTCPLGQWCHPTISSSVVPFSSCLQSFPASGSFQMSLLFASGGQSIGVSASTSVLPMNIQDWFPLGWIGCISLQSKGLSRVFSNTTVQKH